MECASQLFVMTYACSMQGGFPDLLVKRGGFAGKVSVSDNLELNHHQNLQEQSSITLHDGLS